ncbi:hypothetical protein ACQE3E_23190 (plasmid) [Methylomonas sp. MED-D]|uniref:hypothetical protein n=1 Tax=Methylomonas sp. MED-D TaxID=3418768 RepID=UPI003D04B1ED
MPAADKANHLWVNDLLINLGLPFNCGYRKSAPITRMLKETAMKHIHTTATVIRKIKTLAKKIKAEKDSASRRT